MPGYSRLYTARLLMFVNTTGHDGEPPAAGRSGQAAAVCPAGHTWVITYMQAVSATNVAGDRMFVQVPAGQALVWALECAGTGYYPLRQWDGRLVVHAGEQIEVFTGPGQWSGHVTGYDFLLP